MDFATIVRMISKVPLYRRAICPARKYDSALTWAFALRIVSWFAGRMLLSVAYRLGRRVLGVLGTAARSDSALMAEVLVLRHQNAVLRRQIARIRYEPADRAWFAALTALVPRARWAQVFPVTPATLLAWHRTLVNRQYASTRRPRGRPRTPASARALIIKTARENPLWGHRRIQGELTKLGFQIAHSTVWEILHKAGVDPAPRRTGPTWKQFLALQAKTLIATDFFHVDTARLSRSRRAVIAMARG